MKPGRACIANGERNCRRQSMRNLSSLTTEGERDAFRILRNWSQTDTPDFYASCESLGNRLGISLRGASKLRHKFCKIGILRQTAPYVPLKLCARFEWTAGVEPEAPTSRVNLAIAVEQRSWRCAFETAKMMKRRVYETSPTKRRSWAQMAELISAVHDVVDAEESAITIRHLFYRLVGLDVIEKTERAYKSLCGHLSRWRKSGEVSWNVFSDSTRWHIKPPMFDGIADALKRTQETYRRDLWATQSSYVEVWVEKDAIAGVINDVTDQFGVPLFVCRGFASLSSMIQPLAFLSRRRGMGRK